ncbi:MAG: UDP-N-acetylmuramoyl-L-alanyl-D-glutamate--2,6-diaminopimelate ligase [Gammaproteobacteria bacterium]|nr:UDP-N-acetylmuramoyl-L-alanyl-D-glutamate--2,6-diaminopimelate ligase [Gammaproteobacteria bacterium]
MTPRTIDLRELLEGMARVPGVANREVRGLQTDSRRVRPGDLFLALPGMVADGREFIGDAVASGACAVVYETDDGYALRGAPVPVFGISGLSREIGLIADRFYGSPSRRLVVVGVTGTNGKTTCTQLLAQALDHMESCESTLGSPPSPSGRGNEGEGRTPLPLSPAPSPAKGEGSEPLRARGARRCAIIGTLGSGFPGALNASIHTTPDAVTVQRLMADFLGQGAARVAMEVSSHALEQGRVNGVLFHVAVFTNLTRDHLDYHGDMTAYGLAKAKLFDMEGLKYAVINHDDDFGRRLLAGVGAPVTSLSYGIEGGDVRAREVRPSPEGLWLRVQTPYGETELRSPLIGHFNVYNLLAVFTTLLVLGVDMKDAAARLARAHAPCGRVERFGGATGLPLVVVDYAHTPDALEKVLMALREHTQGKLWCVFGCGGDRDRGKRPVMGEIAERLADVVLLTDDNPRHESGDAIIAEIVGGMRASPRIIRDRRAAIKAAIQGAAAGDIVLIAGKGHEDYQQVGDERLPYSDREVVRQLMEGAA